MLRRRVRESRVALPLSEALRLLLQALSPRRQTPSFLLESGVRVAGPLRRSLDLSLARVESGFPGGCLLGTPLELVVKRLGVRRGLSQRRLHALELGHCFVPHAIALAPEMPLDVAQPPYLGFQPVDLAPRGRIAGHAAMIGRG